MKARSNIRQEKSWEHGSAALSKYREREGDCLVPAHHMEEGFPLGNWVGKQRVAGRSGKLSAERMKKLHALGFQFSYFDPIYPFYVHALIKFRMREGHCNVPPTYITTDGLPLGAWVSHQRRRKDKLTAKRKRLLNEQGFIWDRREYEWHQGFDALATYKEREGHCLVPRNHVEGRVRLGRWVDRQRQNKKKGKLSADRIRRLNSIGFDWKPRGRR